MTTPFIIALYFILPALVLYACQRVTWIDKIGSVVLCYLSGFLIAKTFSPELSIEALKATQENLVAACIVFSLPLMLLSINLKQWLYLGPKTLIAALSSVTSIIALSIFSGWLFADEIADIWKLVGLSTALYTGGTPNLAAVKEALQVDNNLFLLVHTYDTIFTMSYIIFVATIAQRVFSIFLPSFKSTVSNAIESSADANKIEDASDSESTQNYSQLLQWQTIKGLIPAILLTTAIAAVAIFLARTIGGEQEMAIAMISLTIMTLIASSFERIRTIACTFELGMYIVLCFCVILGSMITGDILDQMNWNLALYLMIIVFGSMLMHAIICYIFKIDTDTFIITSVAAICSPPFIAMVAGALKNREVLLSGITVGVLGYAFGNILGISIAYLFKSFIY